MARKSRYVAYARKAKNTAKEIKKGEPAKAPVNCKDARK